MRHDPDDLNARLMLCDVPLEDTARLRAIVDEGSRRLRLRWSLDGDAAVRLVIFGGTEPHTIPGLLEASPLALRLVPRQTESLRGTDALFTPLRHEDVIDALVAAEQRGSSTATPPGGWSPSAGHAVPSATHDRVTIQAVRLKRWPPVEVLGSIPFGARMAGCMSARFVTVHELSEMARVPIADCARFIRSLIAFDLVRVRELEVSHSVDMNLRADQSRITRSPLAQLLTRLRLRMGDGHGGL